MRVCPQTVDTPRGHVLGWKSVTWDRQPLFATTGRNHRQVCKYSVGTAHIAQGGLPFHWEFKSARELAKKRRGHPGRNCLPGIHVCRTLAEAETWIGDGNIIIPVAYSRGSIVGKKGDDIIVVYRIKVLG